MSRHSGGGGGCALIVLVALGWLLIVTWPWWLLLVPTIGIVVLIVNKTLRIRIVTAFKDEDVDAETARIRKRMMRSLVVLGAISVFFCLLEAGLDEMQWWLIPLLYLTLAIRLYAMGCKSHKWPLLQRAFCDNLLELALIISAVLIAYTLVLWRFHALPLDAMTLKKLTDLEKEIETTHKKLEDYKPDFYALIACVFAMLALRVAEKTWPTLRSTAATAMKMLVNGVKWAERACSAAAIAASLTFLATQQGGPLSAPISLSLKDATKDYEAFRSDLGNHVDIALRHALVNRAWIERPPALNAEMTRAAELFKERREFEAEQSKATESFEIKPQDAEPFPLTANVPNNDVTVEAVGVIDDPPSPSWTPGDLRRAASEAKGLAATEKMKPGDEKNENTEEMAKEALDEISPAEKLFAQSSMIELLKTHYPVFGEFVDAVSSSISEASFDAIRNSIVRRIIERRSAGPGISLSAVVSQEAGADIGGVPLVWSQFDESWTRTTQARLRGYGTEIARAKVGLEKLAAEKQLKKTEDAARWASATRELMTKVARETDSQSLLDKAMMLKKLIGELLALGRTWPALKQATAEENHDLSQIFAQIGASGLSDIQTGAGNSWTTPLDGISYCGLYVQRKLIKIVAESAESAPESEKLRDAMGRDYDVYYMAWQHEVDVVRKRKEEQERRQAEAIREEHIREQEWRDSHPVEVEHPVEIP